MKILWCITGAGHFLPECVSEFEEIAKTHELACILSNAGKEVAETYCLTERIEKLCETTISEKQQGYSTPLSGSIRFDAAVIAPATANTLAKLALGIADSAVTNIASQFIKRKIPVILLPTDYESQVTTTLPSGRKVKVHCRDADLKNVEVLKKEEGINIITNPKDIILALTSTTE